MADSIVFKDALGVVITTLDVGFKNSASVSVSVTSTQTGTFKGTITLNGQQVGEVAFDATTGSKESWYIGNGQPFVVNDGDVVKVSMAAPTPFEASLPVKRSQPKVATILGTGWFLNQVRALGSAVPVKQTLKTLVETVATVLPNQGVAYLGVLKKDAETLRKYLSNGYPLPEVKVYAYDNAAALNAALANYVPLTPRQIFDNWDRFDTDSYFAKGVGATGAAASWTYNDSLSAAQQTANTGTYNGFLSTDAYENYDLDVVVRSDAADDDDNAIVLAAYREANLNHSLSLMVTRGGMSAIAGASVWFDYNTASRGASLINGPVMTAGNWNGAFMRVKVSRKGDTINIWNSAWNSTVLPELPTFTIDLNASPRLATFKGAKRVGFGNYSQASSYFTDVNLQTGLVSDSILDLQYNRFYRYDTALGQWAVVPGVRAQTIYGVRTIQAVDTGKRYQLNADGTITALT